MIYLVGSNLEFEGVKTLVLNEIKFNKFSVNLAEFDALVLTSKNSVNALKFNQISPASLQIYSIGEGTSRAASEFGFAQIYTAQNAHGNDFAAEIAPFLKNKKTLFLRARETASSVGEILRSSGVNLTQIIAYENVFKPLEKEQKPPKKSPPCAGIFLFITALDAKKPLPHCKRRILLRRKPDLRRKTGQAFR